MSRSLNKLQVIGNLGKDPEMKYLDSGVATCRFSVATTESWNGKDGSKQERTEWHNITAWDKLAEICGKYLKKGSKVYLEGSVESRQYEQDGVTKYFTGMRLRDMMMLDKLGDREETAEEEAPSDYGSGVDLGEVEAKKKPISQDDLPF